VLVKVSKENYNDFSATTYMPCDDEPHKSAPDAPSAGWRSHVLSAAELRRMTFPEAPFVVAGLILEGLTILAGRPKIGKSWLALAVCLAVAQGHRVLGNLATTRGDVLYAALEDNPRRLQKRIDKLLSPFSAEWPARLTLATSWRRLDDGGVDDIAEWAASVSNPRLVVLDTLAGVRPPKQNGEALYDADYRALVELHRLAVEKGFAVLVLHHTRVWRTLSWCSPISSAMSLGESGSGLFANTAKIAFRVSDCRTSAASPWIVQLHPSLSNTMASSRSSRSRPRT
jgi:hypothetical protein